MHFRNTHPIEKKTRQHCAVPQTGTLGLFRLLRHGSTSNLKIMRTPSVYVCMYVHVYLFMCARRCVPQVCLLHVESISQPWILASLTSTSFPVACELSRESPVFMGLVNLNSDPHPCGTCFAHWPISSYAVIYTTQVTVPSPGLSNGQAPLGGREWFWAITLHSCLHILIHFLLF